MPDPAYDKAVQMARREKAHKKLLAYYKRKPVEPGTDGGIKEYQRAIKRWIRETPADIRKTLGIKGGLAEPGIAEPVDMWRKRVGDEQAQEWDSAEMAVLDDLDNVDYQTLPPDVRAAWEAIDNEGKIDTRMK
jgi:hypothetical protein